MAELETFIFSYDDESPAEDHPMTARLFGGELVQVAFGDRMWGYETPDDELIFVDFAHKED